MKGERKNNRITIIVLVGCAALAFCVSLGLSYLIQVWTGSENDHFALVDAIIATIGAVLVLYQLRDSAKQEAKQTDVDECNFILEYNRSFIENGSLSEIEAYMEARLTGNYNGSIKNLSLKRQELVNYLVYLEGFSSCVLNRVLQKERIDDLFAYRYFLAMNHPEVQEKELRPFAAYYKGCFRLYDEWMTYRIINIGECNNGEIPLFDTSIFYWKDYEKYATPHIKAKFNSEGIFVEESGKKVGCMRLEAGRLIIEIGKKCKHESNKRQEALHQRKLICAMLKMPMSTAMRTLLNKGELSLVNTSVSIETVLNDWYCICKFHTTGSQTGDSIRQIRGETELLQVEQLHDIAKLIFETDAFIYKDMLGNAETAQKVLPQLFQSGLDVMFHPNNLYVYEKNGKVVGVLLWYKGRLAWDKRYLQKELEQQKLTVPALDQVAREYMDGYKEETEVISVLNLCVDSDFRGQGIGKKLLKRFLEEHPSETAELCVLSDNTSAKKLYNSCGFAVVGEPVQAYPASMTDHHTRETMRYIPGRER